MPTYEYKCLECGKESTLKLILQDHNDQRVSCPSWGKLAVMRESADGAVNRRRYGENESKKLILARCSLVSTRPVGVRTVGPAGAGPISGRIPLLDAV